MPKFETNTRKIIARLEHEGWTVENGKEHDLFRYADFPGVRITVPRHRELSPGVARAISPNGPNGKETAVTYYVGIMDGSGEVWGFRIPDCSGAYGGGAMPEEAIASAVSGLASWAKYAQSDGEDLPRASSLADLKDQIEENEIAVQIRFCWTPGARFGLM